MSLVPDYDSNTDSEDEQAAFTETNNTDRKDEKLHFKLPSPETAFKIKHSVFSNPFKEAEEARFAILERHVKMVSFVDENDLLNGRQVCWQYKRSGRCKFGNRCRYAHDHELQNQKERSGEPNPLITVAPDNVAPDNVAPDNVSPDNVSPDNVVNTQQKRKLKGGGLTDTLSPSKKTKKLFSKCYNKFP